MSLEKFGLDGIETNPRNKNTLIINGMHSRQCELVNDRLSQYSTEQDKHFKSLDVNTLDKNIIDPNETNAIILNLSNLEEFAYAAEFINANNLQDNIPIFAILYSNFFENKEQLKEIIFLGEEYIYAPFRLYGQETFFNSLFMKMEALQNANETLINELFKLTDEDWSDFFIKIKKDLLINNITLRPSHNSFSMICKNVEITSELTKIPMRLFAYLIYNANRTISIAELIQFTYGRQADPEADGTVRVNITRIRKIIEKDFSNPKILKTVRKNGHGGEGGYVFNLSALE
jgi:DNA-binding winged helix-turn-helix (wHTH) protein